ncbi:hypothetical protein LZ30DRAFT_735449 [Colletotrichum cereale]|nr:hypothetical protein LZ30DRAFT_735449 [Colletotrichum cereale]
MIWRRPASPRYLARYPILDFTFPLCRSQLPSSPPPKPCARSGQPATHPIAASRALSPEKGLGLWGRKKVTIHVLSFLRLSPPHARSPGSQPVGGISESGEAAIHSPTFTAEGMKQAVHFGRGRPVQANPVPRQQTHGRRRAASVPGERVVRWDEI